MWPPRDVGVAAQRGAEAGAVEDVVAEDERDRVVADEVGADEERLGQAVGAGLHGVRELDAPRASRRRAAARTASRSSGVVMTRISRMPAIISVDSG